MKQIIDKMTLKEKVAFCDGANFWETKKMKHLQIPSLFMCDGPHGLRKQNLSGGTDMLGINDSELATCFPTAVTTAATWDVELIEEIGKAIAAEAVSKGVGLVLGPGANLKRNPLCGRNFEYFSEDPYLTGKMAAGFIRGLQSSGTAASLKHFAFNNQEFSRLNSDSVMDERTKRELYLQGFEIAVKEAKPKTIMSAYNKINGVHCGDSKELLTDLLRDEWGFEGMVVTDWGAMNDRVKAFSAGCDLNMPGGTGYMEKDVLRAVKEGRLSEQDVDRCVERVLKLVMESAENLSHIENREFDAEYHHQLAARGAEEGAVLLKNDDAILPLKKEAKVAVIGSMAEHPRYQGAGSSHINPYRITTLKDAMPEASFAIGCDEKGSTSEALLNDARNVAQEADVVVLMAGLPAQYESEGFDRENMKMPQGHLDLIDAVAEVNDNVVVVLSCGSAVECPWEEKVKGVLYLGLSGQAQGEAIVNLLYGKVNPSGKLAETWPMVYEDCPSAHFYGEKNAKYKEGIYVGYRYYDKAKVPVRYPFGYGLSYTEFAYSDLKVDGMRVMVKVKNVGTRAGAEVAQLYVEMPQDGIHRPVKELKAYAKVMLEPGEEKEVHFTLDDRSFSVWKDGWVVPGGTYRILVGGSSDNLPLAEEIVVQGEDVKPFEWQSGSWYENPNGYVTKEDFEKLLGYVYIDVVARKGQFTMDNSVMEMKDSSFLMRILYKIVENMMAKQFGGIKDYDNPEFRMLMTSSVGAPLRSMQICGGIKVDIFRPLLKLVNGLGESSHE